MDKCLLNERAFLLADLEYAFFRQVDLWYNKGDTLTVIVDPMR